MTDTIELLKTKITGEVTHHPGIYTYLNPYSYLAFRENKELYSQFDALYIDGEWLRKFIRIFLGVNVQRRSFDFTSMAKDMLRDAEQLGWRVAVVGSTRENNDAFVAVVTKIYPDLNICYHRDGFFNGETDFLTTYESIRASQADLVVVGMGALLQEKFLVYLQASGWKGMGFTCGGFIHQTSSTGGDYYPGWIDKLNLRFLYRIYDEPKLAKRYLIDYPIFVVCFFQDLVRNKLRKTDNRWSR